MTETERVEFKTILNDKLEKEIVAFLNSSRGGELYIGMNDKGKPIGIENSDLTERQIKDRIKNNISPDTIGLFEIVTSRKKDYIQIIISSGNQKPYYIKKYGRCPEGCYIRIGSSAEKRSEERIFSLFQKREKRTLTNIESDNQNLTFNYLRNRYTEAGFDVGDNFEYQLELYTKSKRFNRLAYLLSDQFASPIQYAKYSGDDVFDLTEQKTFVNQSLIKTASELLSLFQSRNRTYTQITPTGREDKSKFNPIALRELIVNALVHNDYRGEGLPTFEDFSNRFEISSLGGLPQGFTKEDFFGGYSLPTNPELIRVFRDLGYAERLGTGIRRVLKFYPKEIFFFSPSFLRVSVPFYRPKEERNEQTDNRVKILMLIKNNPSITRNELAKRRNVSSSTIYREIHTLVKEKKLIRQGSNKKGYWIIRE
mgnify:CR=1 FL=1